MASTKTDSKTETKAPTASLSDAEADAGKKDAKPGQEGLTEEQIETQKEELKAGKDVPKADLSNIEDANAGHWSPHIRGQFPDNRVAAGASDKGTVMYGHFCTVTDGDHEGTFGVFVDVLSVDDQGYPELVQVRPRGNPLNVVTVKYSDLEPAESRGNGTR